MRKIAYYTSLTIIFVIPWENLIDIPGVGTVSKIAGLLVAAIWVASALNERRFRKPSFFHLIFLLFIIWNILSIYWSVDIDKTLSRIQTYVQIGILVFIIWDIYTTPKNLETAMQVYILGAYVSIGSLIYNFIYSNEVEGIRHSATGFNDNDIGIILALGIPLAWYLINSNESRKKNYLFKLLNLGYIPATFLSILLTASRASFIATIPGIIFILISLTRLKIHWRVLIIVTMIGALLAIIPLVPDSSYARLSETTDELGDGDWNGRVRIWREGIVIFSENPILGIGSGAFKTAAVENRKVAHNFAIAMLAELGIVGFILFSLLLTIVLYYALKQEKWKSKLWCTVLIIWFLGAATHNWEQRKQTWLFMSLVIVSSSLSVKSSDSDFGFNTQNYKIQNQHKVTV